MATNEFIVKLGKTKAELLDEHYTRFHNETILEIGRKAGSEGLHLWIILSTYAYGNKVEAYPSNTTLIDDVGKVSERTIQRWKKRLADIGAVKIVPCRNLDGLQTVNITVLNASWPEYPDGWNEFAPNGYVMVNGSPMLDEDYEKMANKLRKIRPDKNLTPENTAPTKMSPPPRQKCHPSPDKNVTPNMFDEPRQINAGESFFEGEEEKTIKKINNVCVENETDEIMKNAQKSLGIDPALYGVGEIKEWLTRYTVAFILDQIEIIREQGSKNTLKSLRTAMNKPWSRDNAKLQADQKKSNTSESMKSERHDRVVPAAQSGKYERFYQVYKKNTK